MCVSGECEVISSNAGSKSNKHWDLPKAECQSVMRTVVCGGAILARWPEFSNIKICMN